MNLETLLLRSLFAACATVCVLVLTAMLITRSPQRPTTALRADASHPNTTLASRSQLCGLPPDGVTCLGVAPGMGSWE